MIIFKKYILPSFSFSPSNSKPIYSLGVLIYIIMCIAAFVGNELKLTTYYIKKKGI